MAGQQEGITMMVVNTIEENLYSVFQTRDKELTKKIIEVDIPKAEGNVMPILIQDYKHENLITKYYSICTSLDSDISMFVQNNNRETYRKPEQIIHKLESLRKPLKDLKYPRRALDSLALKWITQHLDSDVDGSTPRSSKDLKDEMEYRVFLVQQIGIVLSRIKLLYCGCLWFYYAKKRFANDTKKYWADGLEALTLKGDGRTPLLLAADLKSILMLKFVIKKPLVDFLAMMDKKGEKFTALHIVVSKNDEESAFDILFNTPPSIRQELLDKQSIPNLQTALHIACTENNLPMVKLLVQCGATFNVKNKDQLVPMDCCKDGGPVYLFLKDITEAFIEAQKIDSTSFQTVDIARHNPNIIIAWNAKDFGTGIDAVDTFYSSKP